MWETHIILVKYSKMNTCEPSWHLRTKYLISLKLLVCFLSYHPASFINFVFIFFLYFEIFNLISFLTYRKFHRLTRNSQILFNQIHLLFILSSLCFIGLSIYLYICICVHIILNKACESKLKTCKLCVPFNPKYSVHL